VDARGETEQGLERCHRGPPPVEAEGELVQVGLEVIVPDAVVGATKPGPEIVKNPKEVGAEV
jgi:hypothetical protein